MAERPIFIPKPEGTRLVQERSFSFVWHKGMAPSQKKKNVLELHSSALALGLAPILEVSTKSEEKLGQRLSAFNLKVKSETSGEIPLECAFQGSKVFERGGPFIDLYKADPRDAKKDLRLQESGSLVEFNFEGQHFPLMPKTAFYDWLFLQSLFEHREYLKRLHFYAGFSDIEFNPERSINCQARSCALFVALQKQDLLEEALRSPLRFIQILTPDSLAQPHSRKEAQGNLPI